MPQFVMEPTHLAEQVRAELQNMGYLIVQNGRAIRLPSAPLLYLKTR